MCDAWRRTRRHGMLLACIDFDAFLGVNMPWEACWGSHRRLGGWLAETYEHWAMLCAAAYTAKSSQVVEALYHNAAFSLPACVCSVVA
jgi:hypothetical protein